MIAVRARLCATVGPGCNTCQVAITSSMVIAWGSSPSAQGRGRPIRVHPKGGAKVAQGVSLWCCTRQQTPARTRMNARFHEAYGRVRLVTPPPPIPAVTRSPALARVSIQFRGPVLEAVRLTAGWSARRAEASRAASGIRGQTARPQSSRSRPNHARALRWRHPGPPAPAR